MIRIDFYVLKQQRYQQSLLYSCRLVNKAYEQQSKILINCNSLSETKLIDDLLWTHNDISFLPHSLFDKSNKYQESIPIIITPGFIPENFCGILINLHENPALLSQNFSRILELVPDEEPWKTQSRKKYSHYKEQGAELILHEIK